MYIPLDRIGTGSDRDPDVPDLDRIGSRSSSGQLDRIGSRSKKIGSDPITAMGCKLYGVLQKSKFRQESKTGVRSFVSEPQQYRPQSTNLILTEQAQKV